LSFKTNDKIDQYYVRWWIGRSTEDGRVQTIGNVALGKQFKKVTMALQKNTRISKNDKERNTRHFDR
jgi:hypothetical protein